MTAKVILPSNMQRTQKPFFIQQELLNTNHRPIIVNITVEYLPIVELTAWCGQKWKKKEGREVSVSITEEVISRQMREMTARCVGL